MKNELILVLSLLISFGGVLIFFRLFGKTGVFAWTVIATIAANIEVLVLVHAFGMEMTLGNTLFAATFLSTDILSENYGKKAANRAVMLGVAANITFVIISQSWFLYIPSENDWVMPAVTKIFKNTPSIMFASLAGYVVSELYDVWIYHKLWDFTAKKTGNSQKFLWFRNNIATLSAQLINVIIFTVIAFWHLYPPRIMLAVGISTYVIYLATSLLDTPFVYISRKIYVQITPKKTN